MSNISSEHNKYLKKAKEKKTSYFHCSNINFNYRIGSMGISCKTKSNRFLPN